MSRKENGYDNAPWVIFFRSITLESAQYQPGSTLEQVISLSAEFIDKFYNPEHLGSVLDHVSKTEYDQSYTKP